VSTHYTTLGIGEQATPEEIRRAYRRLVLLTHPDRTPDPAEHRRYLAINEAYETLSDPARRQRYDYVLRRPTAPPEAAAADLHPDPALRRRGRRRASGTVYPPGSSAYAKQYARYMPLGRWANRLVLLFALLLVLDSQWTISYLTEPIESVDEYKVYNKRGTVVGSYFRVKTPNVNFKLKTDLPPVTTRVDLRCSTLFK